MNFPSVGLIREFCVCACVCVTDLAQIDWRLKVFTLSSNGSGCTRRPNGLSWFFLHWWRVGTGICNLYERSYTLCWPNS
jgi:hypothetical protein